MNEVQKMKKVSLLFMALFIVSPVLAKDYFFKEISTHATILSNSDIVVQENYTYSFEDSFTYVYRSFFMDQIESINNFRVWNAETGQVYSPSISYDSGDKYYRWDIAAQDEDQTYVMEYTIVGLIKDHNETADYVWYSLVPVDREKRIESFSFLLTFPADLRDSLTPRLSRTTASWSWVSEDTILFTETDIEPYGAFDIDLYMPEGTIEFYITPSQLASTVASAFLGGATLLIFGLLSFIVRRDYNLYGKDPIPDDVKIIRRLRPALAGVVLEEKVDIKEVEATILDLAIRGYIYIKEEEKKSFFGRKEIWFIKTKSTRGLMDYETKVMEGIFGTKEKVKVSSLKNKFFLKVPDILDSMHEEAAKHKLFEGRVDKTMMTYVWKFVKMPLILMVTNVLTIATFLGMGFDMLDPFPTTVFGSFLSLIPLFIIASVGATAMPRKTKMGAAHSNRYNELKNWMKKYPLKEGRLFDEYLPYATAFGIQRVCINKLKDLEGYKSDWYSGPYTAGSFAALHSSMAKSFASPHSSGGGGGGFGGGGGGGGGGAGAG
jgi:uncharacterized membrane protein